MRLLFQVHAANIGAASSAGSWQAHHDTISCLGFLPGVLATASWDCSVKLWRQAFDHCLLSILLGRNLQGKPVIPQNCTCRQYLYVLQSASPHAKCCKLAIVTCVARHLRCTVHAHKGRSWWLPQAACLICLMDMALSSAYPACRLEEGRQPWSTSCPVASSDIDDHVSGIWAMACDAMHDCLVSGTEEGVLTRWDLRWNKPAWQVCSIHSIPFII